LATDQGVGGSNPLTHVIKTFEDICFQRFLFVYAGKSSLVVERSMLYISCVNIRIDISLTNEGRLL